MLTKLAGSVCWLCWRVGGLDVIAYYSGWLTVLAFAGCLNILSMHGSCLAMRDMLLPWLVILVAMVAGWLSGSAGWLLCLNWWLCCLARLLG
jgi:hypothetical protein